MRFSSAFLSFSFCFSSILFLLHLLSLYSHIFSVLCLGFPQLLHLCFNLLWSLFLRFWCLFNLRFLFLLFLLLTLFLLTLVAGCPTIQCELSFLLVYHHPNLPDAFLKLWFWSSKDVVYLYAI